MYALKSPGPGAHAFHITPSFVRDGLAGFARASRRIRIFNLYGHSWASWAGGSPGPKAGGAGLEASVHVESGLVDCLKGCLCRFDACLE
jgi:hypothetical protein